jgi:hypothetical protein
MQFIRCLLIFHYPYAKGRYLIAIKEYLVQMKRMPINWQINLFYQYNPEYLSDFRRAYLQQRDVQCLQMTLI